MKAVKKIETTSRNSWLAGVGAYSQSVEKSADTLDKLYVDGNSFIQDLIVRGESVEAQLKTKLTAKLKGIAMFEDKIAMLKAKFGLHNDRQEIQLEKLSSKVDNLIEVVAKLAQQKAAEKSIAKPKVAATSTAKTPAKTAAKSTTKATTAKATTAATPAAASKTAAPAKAKAAKAPAKPRARKTAATKPDVNKQS
ncbi:hypothetical protein [Aliiglaciecola sp. LCG003]|uniref:hypothetical protein n=1 Tax=Aliiglaciecola sp. LCG003 TaxID=3053655 RepID=UPI0025722387|nr:hypothetical protein [Aliiglaciecola sp. LCG003]WJG08196.1 hypothetical protein QR722_12695 [Aliiglaciecola sp. LCG003]